MKNYNKIYLATKANYYKLNMANISKLTDNLLFKSSFLKEEIEILYPNKADFSQSKLDKDSNLLFDRCIESSLDHEIIVKILWNRIYVEQLAMKFISLRYSSYNERFSHKLNESKNLAHFLQ
jgi:hypothetical protein